jgi:hypothetical protein
MNLLKVIFLPFFVFSFGCNHGQTSEQSNTRGYEQFKSTFDSTLISHFPTKRDLHDEQENAIVSYTAAERNNVGLFLYEYLAGIKYLDSIENIKILAKYNSYDTCLLIVNRFETKHAFEYNDIRIITDSSLLERDCYDSKYPVPKFIDYNGANVTACGLDSTFTIYVLEAKPEKPFPQYDLKPFKHMPAKWANGYSKGIAISRESRTVIYWAIIW